MPQLSLLVVLCLNFSASSSLTQTQSLNSSPKQNMSTLNRLFDLPEQICYVQCSFCTTILLVIIIAISMYKVRREANIFILIYQISLVFQIYMQVSVPCGSLSMVVTVRCGHCTSLLSVNMMKASFLPLHLLASLSHGDEVSSFVGSLCLFIKHQGHESSIYFINNTCHIHIYSPARFLRMFPTLK